MVRTPEVEGVPPFFPANGVGPMPADVEDLTDAAALAPDDDNGLGADPASPVVTWVSDLALVSDVHSRPLEDLAHLLLVDQRVGVERERTRKTMASSYTKSAQDVSASCSAVGMAGLLL